MAALDEVRALPRDGYPAPKPRGTGIPHPKSWERIDPEAARRWAKVRPAVNDLACDLGGMQPSLVAPPAVLQEALFSSEPVTRDRLLDLGARPWQADFLAPLISEALAGR